MPAQKPAPPAKEATVVPTTSPDPAPTPTPAAATPPPPAPDPAPEQPADEQVDPQADRIEKLKALAAGQPGVALVGPAVQPAPPPLVETGRTLHWDGDVELLLNAGVIGPGYGPGARRGDRVTVSEELADRLRQLGVVAE